MTKRKMKDSGCEWLGDIPALWGIARIGGLYTVRNEKCSDKDFAPLSVTMKGVVPQLADVAKTDDGDNRKLVRKGDFVINSRSDRRGSCGISPLDGSVSVINTVLKPRGEMDPGYYNWAFHSSEFADEFYAWGHGIVDDLWTTRWSDMKSILVARPPLPEQRKIAAFLDGECGKIDVLRGKVEKQIAALEEYRKSVITEAVTKGIKRGRKMKPSGVEWFDTIPTEWSCNRIKFFCYEITDGSHFSPQGHDDGFPYVTATDVRGVGIDFSKTIKISEEDYQQLVRSGCSLKKDDVLLVKDGATTGRVGYMTDNTPSVALSSVAMLRSKPNCSKFLMYVMMSNAVQEQILLSMAGSAMPRTTVSKIGGYYVTEPPIPEQREIAAYLDKKCAAIDSMVAKCREELNRLAEYKKSLIYEYVTGKKEVA